jgi:hypothetical protein
MDANYEAFLLYYTAFHEWEIGTKDIKDMLLSDVGEEGLKIAVSIFREERLKREENGDRRVLYDVLKGA